MSTASRLVALQSLLALDDTVLVRELEFVCSTITQHNLLASALERNPTTASVMARWRDRLQNMLEPRSSALALAESSSVVLAALTLLSLTVRNADHACVRVRLSVWSKILLQILKETDQVEMLLSAAECMRDLISRAMLWPDTRRELADVLPRFMNALVPWISNSAVAIASLASLLDVIADCLRLAQTWLRPSTNQLETHITPLLQHNNASIRQSAALCITLLCLCRSDEALSNYLKRAYLSIQHVVDTIFSNETVQSTQSSKSESQDKKSNTATANTGSSSRVDISAWMDASTNDDQRNDTQKPAEVVLPFEFPALSSQLSSTEMLALLQARLNGLIAVVHCVLTTPTKHTCRVDIVDWLALIERVLKLEISIAEIRSFSATKISALGAWMVLPQIQCMMLNVLQLLLKRLSAHLLPAAGRLASRLMDLLRTTAFDADQGQYSHPQLRETLYQSMESLLRAFGGAALLRTLVIPSLPFLLDDVKLPSTSRVEVKQVDNVGSSAEESSEKREISHKSAKQTAKIMEQGGASGPPGLDFVNDVQLSHIDAVGVSALSCLRLMIAMAGPLLTPSNRASIDRLLLSLAISTAHVNSVASAGADYRIAALSALLSSVQTPCAELPPSLPLLVKLLRQGSSDHSAAVRAFCSDSLLAVRALVQPRAPSAGLHTQAIASLATASINLEPVVASALTNQESEHANTASNAFAATMSATMPVVADVKVVAEMPAISTAAFVFKSTETASVNTNVVSEVVGQKRVADIEMADSNSKRAHVHEPAQTVTMQSAGDVPMAEVNDVAPDEAEEGVALWSL